MKFPLSWLKEFIAPLPEPLKIKEVLTDLGLEVDALYADGDDWIFEVAITPNLNHAASLHGVARELKAALDGTLHLPKVALNEDKEIKIKEKVMVSVEEPTLCPRYSCRALFDVKVEPSPDWLVDRLEKSGMRSINNVVDITNLVLLEWGHPLHAFDYDTLEGRKVIVRRAKMSEEIITIDHEKRFLTDETLVIADEKRAIAIAGIMGTSDTEVTEKTKHVLLEAAYFDPVSIRRSSKRIDLHTESSRRFERTADAEAVVFALDRAATLIQQLAGGKLASGIFEVSSFTFTPRLLKLRQERVNGTLGLALSMSEIESLLTRLFFKVKKRGGDFLEVEVPSFRNDVKEEIDLVEEVARLYGYRNIYEKRRLTPIHSSTIASNPLFNFERKMRQLLLGEGLTEFHSCDLIDEKMARRVMADAMPRRALVEVLNPHSAEQSILRPSILPNHLAIVKHNLDHGNDSIAAYEIGRIHFKEKESYHEPLLVAITLSGKRAPFYFDHPAGDFDFLDLKGMVENIASSLKIEEISFAPSTHSAFHPGRQAKIVVGGHEIGIMGEIHPQLAKEVDLTQSLFFAEMSLEDLAKVAKRDIKMKKLPLFPGSTRDWTLTVKEELPMAALFTAIREADSSLLQETTLLDIFRGPRVGQGWKNVTLRFLYREMTETLSQSKVEAEHGRLMEEVIGKLSTNVKQG